ncbi:glycosyltransferase involved in cell wall biosynthesis [Orbus hercynius]|uniref:Glycosyltransferase involved in cell wall biosynthesis n=1 Tax=Orbus hercynius TaxID=593135 RepID=A0A495RBB8_9GAMM|nr:glycosyltransferase [Orbus hercynius]RKS84689.1 glycosyltransferase involved in cell wall biosynthesis [Orbus hercynius]
MKILHVAETIKGGIATVLNQLIAYQTKQDTVVLLIPDSQCEHIKNIDKYDCFLFKRTGRNIASFFSLLVSFIRVFCKEKPDIVHLHSSFAGVICRIMLIFLYPFQRTKVVYCPHAFSFLMTTSINKRRLYVFIERLMQIVTNKIICVSQYEYDQSVNYGLSKNKLVMIYNGVPQWNKDLDTVKNPYPINSKINLLFIGRFDYQKGFDILLDSMPNLANCHLTAIGDFVNDEAIINDTNMHKYDNISFKGWMTHQQIIPYLFYCDAVIVPSRWEGFAIVPLEAMSYSKAIIAANTTSLPEVVENGITGYLFSINQRDSLVKLLLQLDKENLKALGENGFYKYKKNFTDANMLNNVELLYKKMKS